MKIHLKTSEIRERKIMASRLETLVNDSQLELEGENAPVLATPAAFAAGAKAGAALAGAVVGGAAGGAAVGAATGNND